jgi:hypothetical protein
VSINPYQSPRAAEAPPLPAGVYVYRPAGGLVATLTALLLLIAGTDLAMGLLSVVEAIADVDLEREVGGPAELAVGLAYLAAGLVALPATIATIVAFCIWVHRANKNARALGAQQMQFTPGWCVGWFFIPIMNLFKPYQAVKEIYQASEPAASFLDWRLARVPALLGVWWGIWIASNILSNVETRLRFGSTAPTAQRILPLALLSSLSGTAAALLCLAVVRSIHRRQEAKAARQSGAMGPA